ncbi:MAG: Uma2 family endonuclease [Lewinella sp.]|jgi:Uma2 family endonuclease|uniref:Uma2 family endonuclease n=1 Tax=Lewinella sp. TaxID=2004506 RepID=UPI003D6B839D
MEAKKIENISLEDYLVIEQEANTRYEYHDGIIYAMAGGSIEHGLISGNTYGELKFGLRENGSDCIVINSDVKLHVESLNKFLYPDVMVVCDEMERSTKENNAIINPSVIVEVLSNSTEAYDRGDKFFAYQQIASLKEYILIHQYKAQVEIYTRKKDLWRITRIEGLEESFLINALGISINLKNVYEDVVFVD